MVLTEMTCSAKYTALRMKRFQIKVASNPSIKQVLPTYYACGIWEYPNTEINTQKEASGFWDHWGPRQPVPQKTL